MGQQEVVRVNVLLESIDPATVQKLEDVGLHITEVLGEIGIVIGSVDRADIPRLCDVPGVTAVEVSRRIEKASGPLGVRTA